MRGYALPAEAVERRITAATDPDEAFDALYREYAPALRAYCRARLRNPADAEDACHEVILRAYAALPRFKSESRLWPWLATIAANVCRDMQRRQVTAAAHATYVDVAVDDLDELAAARTRRAILADALEAMPERYRAHVYLRDLEGWSYEEIASYDGSSVASVRSTLHRARSVLRERVRDTAERRREWPMPAFLPLVFSRLRARLARARTTTAPVAESLGRVSVFDSVLGVIAQPAFAQGVLSLAAVVGIGIGVAADHYVDPGAQDLEVAMLNAGSSSDLPEAIGTMAHWGGALGGHGSDVVPPGSSADAPATLPEVSAPSDSAPSIETPGTPSAPDAPAMPSIDASAPSAPPPPVHMTSGPAVSAPDVEGSDPSYAVALPSATVDTTIVSEDASVEGDDVGGAASCDTSSEGGVVGNAVCTGQVPSAPSIDAPEVTAPTSDLTLTP